jgi:hypothetical protein
MVRKFPIISILMAQYVIRGRDAHGPTCLRAKANLQDTHQNSNSSIFIPQLINSLGSVWY